MTEKIKVVEFKYGLEYATEELAQQILGWTEGTGAKGGVVGLSGGIDSTTVAYLCKYAFDLYNQIFSREGNRLNLLGVIMPSKVNDPQDTKDGLRVANLLGIEYIIVPIQPSADVFVEQTLEAIQSPTISDDLRKKIRESMGNSFDNGNLYSELRAKYLSRLGAGLHYRVMGTGNKDEDYVLGYFTKRGDGAVDNNILGNLPKRLVRELAAHLGVPNDIVHKTPSAGLWVGQTDEDELGYNYSQAEIIQNCYDQGKSIDEIVEQTGFHEKIVKDVDYRHRTTKHKREVPPVGKITLEYR